jgi:hypothetical protein
MFNKISDFFHVLTLWFCSYSWRDAKKVVKEVNFLENEERDTSKRIFKYFRILNEVPGLKVWMIDVSPFGFTSYTLKMTLENNGLYDHKMEPFPTRKKLLNFMEGDLGGMTLSVEGKSFTFPNFRTPKELMMKLQLRGCIPDKI